MVHRFRYLILGCLLAGILGLLTIGFWSRPMLVIENASHNIEIFSSRAKAQDNIWIVFINSVENLPVADHFLLTEDDRLCFTETIYQAPYAGYLGQNRARTVAPGTTRIKGYNRQMPEITFYAGYDSRHMLFFNGHWVDLYEQAQGGDLIRIRVRFNSPLSALFTKDAHP